jgi:hypothetical protein
VNQQEVKHDSEVNSTESEASENEVVPLRKAKEKTTRETRKRFTPSAVKSVDLEPNVEGSARTKGKIKNKAYVNIPIKPKMIHTEKSKPAEGEGAMTRRRTRSNVTFIKTTTTATTNSDERVRPRTKNVTYHDNVERLPTATFPSSVKPEPENDIADDLRAILKDPMIVDELEASTSCVRNVKNEPSNDSFDESPCNIKEEMMDEMASSNQDGLLRCEMCSEPFTDREQLLMHVRIHI